MALELNGTTGVSLVQDGVVTAADLASTLDLTGKTVTLPAGVGGKVLQVVSTTKTDTFSTTSTSLVDVTGLSVSITPSSASNKILVFMQLTGNGTNLQFSQLVRNSTAIYKGNDAGSRVGVTFGSLFYGVGGQSSSSGAAIFLDSPSTTSATTYKVQIRTQQGTMYINRSIDDTDSFIAGQRTPSSITVMEIAA
jgi:hypothetical protein